MRLMVRYYRSHRAALFALLEVLELEATSTDRRIMDAVEVLRANRHRIGEHLPGYRQGQLIDTSFAGEAWQATLRDRRHPTRLRRRQFEVCVCRRGLRPGCGCRPRAAASRAGCPARGCGRSPRRRRSARRA